MLAQRAARAGSSRAASAGVVSPPSANVFHLTSGRPGWKYAYEEILWSKRGPELKLRALLHALLRFSDPLGRVWWGQATLAEHAGCSERTLRRLLPKLAKAGYVRIEPMTFKKLALAQAELGFPLPERSDDGQAPDLLTLLLEGQPAAELPATTRARGPRLVTTTTTTTTKNHGRVVRGGPRTSWLENGASKRSDAVARVADDPRDLSAIDLHDVGGDPRSNAPPSGVHVQGTSAQGLSVQAQTDEPPASTPPPSAAQTAPPCSSDPTDEQAWRALEAAYDRHFFRVYHARPTNKRISREAAAQIAGHMADMGKLLRARFAERKVELESLPDSPLMLLVDEALRAWFDSPGTNDYLRRVSHRLSALPDDLPFRVRKATETLLGKHAPRPEPRRFPAPVLALVTGVGRAVSPLPPAPPPPNALVLPQSAPTLVVRPSKPSPALPGVKKSLDVVAVLAGLSARPALVELGEHASLAEELLTLARERGAGAEQVLEALYAANDACEKLKVQSATAKTSVVFKNVLGALDGAQKQEGKTRSRAPS